MVLDIILSDLVSEKNIVIQVPFVTCPNIDLNTLDEVEGTINYSKILNILSHTLFKIAFESSSTSEKLKTIFLNQMAEKKVYIELSNRLAGVEKHIKKIRRRCL